MKAPPVAPTLGRFFHIRGAAEYLGMPASRARSLIAAGVLVAVRSPAGRIVGVYERDCDAWLAAARAAVAPPVPRPAVDDLVAALPGAGLFT